MPLKEEHDSAPLTARFGALCYAAWGLFHCKVALDIWRLGAAEHGLAGSVANSDAVAKVGPLDW